MSRFRQSLYWKVSLANFGLLTTLAAIYISLSLVLFRRITDESDQVLYWGLAARMATEIQPLLISEEGFAHLDAIISRFADSNPIAEIYILDDSGIIKADFARLDISYQRFVAIDPIRSFLSDANKDRAPIYGNNPRDSNTAIFSAAPIRFKYGEGYVYVILRSGLSEHTRRIFGENSMIRLSIICLTLSLLVTGALGFLIFWRLTKRFELVTAIVRQYAKGDFGERVGISDNDEIGELATAVNHLADTIVSNISELEYRDKLRRELIADVSHDLRGPAALITGYAGLLLMDDSPLKLEAQHNLDLILRNGERLNLLLSELFELARLEAKEERPQFAPFSLTQVINDTTVIYEKTAAAKGVSLSVEIPGKLPDSFGDLHMVQRVLANLTENALRHSRSGGTVKIHAGHQGELLSVTVEDSGEGISAEARTRVFEKFYQAAEAKGNLPGGNARGENFPRENTSGAGGLGLAIVKRIVEAHGGTIRISSVHGEGTAVTFFIPAVRELAQAGSAGK